MEVTPVNARDADEIERNIAAFARAPNGGLIVTGSALAQVHRDLIITLAARYKLPAVYFEHLFATAGGLISYGPSLVDQFRRAAGYVDKILKGEKPADLPVQAPTEYELVIIASGKFRKGGRDVVTRKPFIAVQRVRLPPGKGEPTSRKRALRGWWQHRSRSVGSRCLSPAVAPRYSSARWS